MPQVAPPRKIRFSSSAVLITLLISPLSCAVATNTDFEDVGGAGVGGAGGGMGPIGAAGKASGGGMPPVAGSSAFGGSVTSHGGAAGGAGKGGASASGGKGGAAGAAGTSSGGNATAGSNAGGTGSTGCQGLKLWKGGDSTLTIAAGEVVQWQGKRYKATTNIAYPNAECAPDAPVMWCADWFEPDGDC